MANYIEDDKQHLPLELLLRQPEERIQWDQIS